MEQFIIEAIQEFMHTIGNPLSDAVAKLLMKAYERGFEDCKKFYHIDDDKFLKEQEEIETKYIGSYKTTTSTDNGKKCKDYRKEIEL